MERTFEAAKVISSCAFSFSKIERPAFAPSVFAAKAIIDEDIAVRFGRSCSGG